MYWFWLVISVIVFLMTTYSLFYKEPKLKAKAEESHNVSDLINYIDEATDKGINAVLFVVTSIIILGAIGVIG